MTLSTRIYEDPTRFRCGTALLEACRRVLVSFEITVVYDLPLTLCVAKAKYRCVSVRDVIHVPARGKAL